MSLKLLVILCNALVNIGYLLHGGRLLWSLNPSDEACSLTPSVAGYSTVGFLRYAGIKGCPCDIYPESRPLERRTLGHQLSKFRLLQPYSIQTSSPYYLGNRSPRTRRRRRNDEFVTTADATTPLRVLRVPRLSHQPLLIGTLRG